jgi:hypothetical protein
MIARLNLMIKVTMTSVIQIDRDYDLFPWKEIYGVIQMMYVIILLLLGCWRYLQMLT